MFFFFFSSRRRHTRCSRDWSSDVCSSDLRVNQETLRTTQQGQITERFTKAIEHVGDTGRLTVRLGGIYALERIATRDAPDYHWQIMEVLTAYVRDNAPWPPNQSSSSPEGPLSP